MKKPFISIIIPTYKDWDSLRECIQALQNQTYPVSHFEVIIVNNDSESNVPEIKLGPNCRIITEGKPGSYAARNAGIKFARGEIIGFTDSDCRPCQKWIEDSVLLFEENAAIGRIGGRVVFNFDSTKKLSNYYEEVFGLNQELYIKKTDAAVTANMFSRHRIFEHVGLFDESLKSGGDIEWGIRAANQGYNIAYCEKCYVEHPPRNIRELLSKSRRAIGGHYQKAKNEGRKAEFQLFMKTMLPPINSIYWLAQQDQISLPVKFKLSILKIVMRYVSFYELALLYIGKEPSRV